MPLCTSTMRPHGHSTGPLLCIKCTHVLSPLHTLLPEHLPYQVSHAPCPADAPPREFWLHHARVMPLWFIVPRDEETMHKRPPHRALMAIVWEVLAQHHPRLAPIIASFATPCAQSSSAKRSNPSSRRQQVRAYPATPAPAP